MQLLKTNYGTDPELFSRTPEAEFLDVIGTKVSRVYPPCYSQSPLLKDFTPLPPPLEQKWFETGL
jgi:hypothetical protein